jgi:hypothetical protein
VLSVFGPDIRQRRQCDVAPDRDGVGAPFAMVSFGQMFSMKMEKICDRAVG